MSSTKALKQRIKSVKNTAQITKAMEVVSATKMRRSQEFAVRARPFAVASLEMMRNLLERTPARPPLFEKREVKTSLLLVVTSDKGLAGAFNANVLRRAELWLQNCAKSSSAQKCAIMAVGKRAKDFFDARKVGICKSFWGFGDFTTLAETLPVADEIIKGFRERAFDEAEVVYTRFRTTLLQETVLKRILPVTKDGIEETVKGILPEYGKYARDATGDRRPAVHFHYEYKFEPSPAEILENLVPQLLRMHIHHVILESNASEHSARMVAMKNASDNAKDLISDLALEYNKARQAGITRELIEITAGKEALEL